MRKYLNGANVPLSLAVFLATDKYDNDDDPNTISATSLIKPVRQLVLSSRLSPEEALIDINNLWASRLGTAIHDGIEEAWINNAPQALSALGYPKAVIDQIVVNPDPDNLPERVIPVYLEKRAYRKVGQYTVSGKFDFVAEGRIEDFKTTSTYTWIKGTKDEDYILQGSIYRWLNPKIITQDEMAIQFIFTDWQAIKAKTDPKYPDNRTKQKIYHLLSVTETQRWIEQKLAEAERYWNTPEADLPLCTDKELWRTEPQYKYFKNPNKTQRSTKNFDNMHDAYARLSADGNVGIVTEVPGQVRACKYCPGFPLCAQKDGLIADGSLQL